MSQPALSLCPPEAPHTVTELIEGNLSLVAHLVRERLAKVPGHVRRDELTSAGMMALVVSAQSYDPHRGVPFAQFAAIRIRGALVDELRGMDWATRSVRRRAREVESVHGQLTLALHRTPRAAEIADAMQVSLRALASLQSDLARAGVLSLQGFATDTEAELPHEISAGPESLILHREKLGYLHDAIAELSERLRFIVVAYFFDQREMSSIATELGVSVVRISQLRAEALRLLRDGMNSQLDPSALDRHCRSSRTAATRQVYFGAIAERGTLASRLSMSTPRGDMVRETGVGSARSA